MAGLKIKGLPVKLPGLRVRARGVPHHAEHIERVRRNAVFAQVVFTKFGGLGPAALSRPAGGR